MQAISRGDEHRHFVASYAGVRHDRAPNRQSMQDVDRGRVRALPTAQQKRVWREGNRRHEFPRVHRIAPVVDSNDDDGETSSASEDSLYSSSCLSPTETSARPTTMKRSHPSSSVRLPPAQRPRADHPYVCAPGQWTPSPNTQDVRDSQPRLPRLAALEVMHHERPAAASPQCRTGGRSISANVLPPLLSGWENSGSTVASATALLPPSPLQGSLRSLARNPRRTSCVETATRSRASDRREEEPHLLTHRRQIPRLQGLENQANLRAHRQWDHSSSSSDSPGSCSAGGFHYESYGDRAWAVHRSHSPQGDDQYARARFMHRSGPLDALEDNREAQWVSQQGHLNRTNPPRNGIISSLSEDQKESCNLAEARCSDDTLKTRRSLENCQRARSRRLPPSKQSEYEDKNAESWMDARNQGPVEPRDNTESEWTKTGERVSAKTGKQVLQRYLDHLNPKASREVWSHDEEEVLWRLQREYGNAWSYIAGLLPGRSENAVKNHWYTQMRMFIGQRGNGSYAKANNGSEKSNSDNTLSKGATSQVKSSVRSFRAHKKHDHEERAKKEDCGERQRGEIATDEATSPSKTAATEHPRETAVDGKDNSAKAENAARAEAADALGMLFSQVSKDRDSKVEDPASATEGCGEGTGQSFKGSTTSTRGRNGRKRAPPGYMSYECA